MIDDGAHPTRAWDVPQERREPGGRSEPPSSPLILLLRDEFNRTLYDLDPLRECCGTPSGVFGDEDLFEASFGSYRGRAVGFTPVMGLILCPKSCQHGDNPVSAELGAYAHIVAVSEDLLATPGD